MENKLPVKYAYLISGLLVFAYLLIRALNTGITYDEAWTLQSFVPQTLSEVISYSFPQANNHMVNTLLIKCAFALGPDTLFVARLPNVAGGLLYIVFACLICSRFLPGMGGLLAFLLLLLNPFLLDFFSLARGYGLALAFQLGSLYFLLVQLRKPGIWSSITAILFAALAVLCNFSILNFWLPLTFLIVVLPWLSKDRRINIPVLGGALTISVLLLLLIYQPVKKLSSLGKLYYGGTEGFYQDTLVSLTKYSLYSPDLTAATLPALNLFLAFFVLTVAASFYFKRQLLNHRNLLLFLLLSIVAATIVQHHLFHTLYLIDRTALFIYPLLILVVCFSLNELPLKKWTLAITAVLSTFFLINFLQHANFYKTATWYFDAHSEKILADLNQIGQQRAKPLKIDFSWPFQSSFGYYKKLHNYPYLEFVKNPENREDLNAEAEYYIYLGHSLEKVGYDSENQKVLWVGKQEIQTYPEEYVHIYQLIKKQR